VQGAIGSEWHARGLQRGNVDSHALPKCGPEEENIRAHPRRQANWNGLGHSRRGLPCAQALSAPLTVTQCVARQTRDFGTLPSTACS